MKECKCIVNYQFITIQHTRYNIIPTIDTGGSQDDIVTTRRIDPSISQQSKD
jgi:hypothetical protein